ncbi:MAG: hypothetical protein CMH57_13640 [Myxococcales bacterium]|nr:hypothetical protein [Myxococcales bacterium]
MSLTEQELAGWLEATVHLDDPEGAAHKLVAYAALLVQHNKRLNLVGRLSQGEVLRDLIVDALLPAVVRRPAGPLMDVGSGAGLPGIPLAIAFPDVPMHLIEPRKKRVTFMSTALRRLGLEHVTLHEVRLEAFTGLRRGEAGTLAAKAFQTPAQWLETAQGWVREGGVIYLYASGDSWGAQARPPEGLEELGRQAHPTRDDRSGVVFQA